MPKHGDTTRHAHNVYGVFFRASSRPEESIEAAYFQHEDGWITFKDTSGSAVYAVPNDVVSCVKQVRANLAYAIPWDTIGAVHDALTGYEARDSDTYDRINALIADLEENYAGRLAPDVVQIHAKG